MDVARATSLAVIVGLAGAWACGSAGAFACEDDAQCAGTGVTGTCEPSGYCSFADPTCESGRRYGARAPADLAEACVVPIDPTSATDASDEADDDDDGDTTSSDTTGTASATSLTTTPVDPTTEGEVDSGEATSAEDGPASSSGADPSDDTTTGEPEPPPCMPVFVDAFDGDALDPEWGTWVSVGCSLGVADGHVEFSIGPSMMEWISAGLYSGVHSFVGGQVRAELVPYAPPLDVISVWLTIYEDGTACEVQIAAEAEHIVIMVAGAYFDGPAVATDEPLWLQLRVDDDAIVHWEYSTDGLEWSEAHSEPAPCDFTNGRSALFAGGVHAENTPIVRAVESYERCEAG